MTARGLMTVDDTRGDAGWRGVLADFDTLTYSLLSEDRMTALFGSELRSLGPCDADDGELQPGNSDPDSTLRC